MSRFQCEFKAVPGRLPAWIAWTAISLGSIVPCCQVEALFAEGLAVDDTVVVVSDTASFVAPGQAAVFAKVGYRYVVGEVRDEWLWVPRAGGWIARDQVVPASDAPHYFTGQIKADPSADRFYRRAVMWSLAGEHHKALHDFDAAIHLDDTDAASLSGRGNCYAACAKFDLALASLDDAIGHNPDSPLAYNNRANVWRMLGDMDKAHLDLDRAVELAPDNAIIRNNRGSCYLISGRTSEAIAEFDRALALNPHDATALNNRGFAAYLEDDYAGAIEWFTRAIRHDRNHFDAFNNAAWIRATCHDHEFRDGQRAVEAATRACELTQHRNWYCLATRAAALAELGEFEQAVDMQQRAISFLPGTIEGLELDQYQRRLNSYRAGEPIKSESTGVARGSQATLGFFHQTSFRF